MEKSLKKWVDCAGHVRLQNQWRILDSSSKIAKSGKIGGTKPWPCRRQEMQQPMAWWFNGGFSTSLKSQNVNDEQQEKGLDQ